LYCDEERERERERERENAVLWPKARERRNYQLLKSLGKNLAGNWSEDVDELVEEIEMM
jgi:hypothetical protein